ncbi:MAG: hypothetical protein ACFFA4_14150 [Promethearchaeota archaeon]
MNETHLVINNIKEEFQKPKPSTKKILNILFDLQAKGKSQKISDSEFFEIVGETFKLNPDFFMKELYTTFMVKLGKIIGAEKRREMVKYIITKYCLFEDEEIIYECKGNVKQTELLEQKSSGKYKMDKFPLTISVSDGDIYLTNYRLIAQGFLKVKGGESTKWFIWTDSLWIFTGGSKRKERKNALIESTPLFGYQFPSKYYIGLGKSKLLHIILYVLNLENRKCTIAIKPTNTAKREDDLIAIFNILRRDVNEVIMSIKEVYEFEKLEKFKRRNIWAILKALWKSEEFLGLPDSDYLHIVKETYKIDPEFFMTSIYPKMMSWNNQSFLSIKEELFAQLRKEGANFN